ncbi:hypothetical protein, partial [Bradyrhizobium sp. CCBAU 11430]|uniref:hypothetical protein n=1 Tax=Bradyrhizobium sp. CCBAU 11430 TaxID=1630881 RepID=UPI0023051273
RNAARHQLGTVRAMTSESAASTMPLASFAMNESSCGRSTVHGEKTSVLGQSALRTYKEHKSTGE